MMLLDRLVSPPEVETSERDMISDILVKFWLKIDFLMATSARMEGPRSSCATEMDLFLVTAATICTDGVLGGRWLCCFNDGIVLLL